MNPEPTLNEVLTSRGYTTAPNPQGQYSKLILDSEGNEVFSGSSDMVWDWLKVQSITILGRRWFQKSYGNTYFTAQILVDGKKVHDLPQRTLRNFDVFDIALNHVFP